MSDDFLTWLEADLVEAMESYELRGRGRRLAVGRVPRLRPARVAAVAAFAVVVLAVLVVARGLSPEPPPAAPRVVGVLRLGGTPMDGVFADGSLWATDFAGSVVRIDPVRQRLVARIPVPNAPVPISAAGGSLWVQTSGSDCQGDLLRVDPGSDRLTFRKAMPYPNEQLGVLAAAGGGAVWVKQGCVRRQGIDRLDRSGAVTAHVALRSIDAMAAAAGSLWVLGREGTLTQIDAVTGQLRGRWPRLAPLTLSDSISWNTEALVADGAGAWVIDTRRSAILRVETGRVARRIPVAPATRPLLARAPDGLWVTTSDRLGGHNRLIRLDPDTGRPTATLELGVQRPVALIPAGDELCVPTSNGAVVFVRATQ
jgi:sugar lactone lactonase YvrE